MIKGTGLFAILLAVGFSINIANAEQSGGGTPGVPTTNQCAEKQAELIAAYESAIARYEAQAREKAARAENIRDDKLEALTVKVERLTQVAEQKFERCVQGTGNEERCRVVFERSLARIANLEEEGTAQILRAFEQILSRLENWLDKREASALNRLNEALRKLEIRCGPGFGPGIGVPGDTVPVQ